MLDMIAKQSFYAETNQSLNVLILQFLISSSYYYYYYCYYYLLSLHSVIWNQLLNAQKHQHGVAVMWNFASHTGTLSKYKLLKIYVMFAYWVRKNYIERQGWFKIDLK